MKSYHTVFSPAEILLPSFANDPERMKKWAVIACDQFTSEDGYWARVRQYAEDCESTYHYMVPEAYLGTEREEKQNADVLAHMKAFNESGMTEIDGLIYLVRRFRNGEERRGIVGKIDLEAYDYSVGSKSAVRATEKTVLERIPPRTKVRAEATVELPHILILTDDKKKLYDTADSLKEQCEVAYDFDLMEGGGHVTGYSLKGDALSSMMQEIEAYEKSHEGLVYAMGDGNHSLAAAKAHWENVKANTGDMTHPARYALCEITSISDDSLVFEPIYRLVKNCDVNDLSDAFGEVTDESGEQRITAISPRGFSETYFKKSTHPLTVGTVQNFLDDYMKDHPEVSCDYIHGEASLIRLAMEGNSVGFLFDGMSKGELFPYVDEHGTLPKKTFSMGEAESKRYYLEMRKITK